MIHFSDKELLSKINSLETDMQVCSNNLATCESNLTEEKEFAAFQKEKNQKLKTVISDTRKNNQILKNHISQNQRDNSTEITYQNEINKLEVAMDILKKQNVELKTKNEKLEQERDAETKKSLQCRSDLRDQKISLTSALNEKQRIESQFNQQKSVINQLESEKEAAESQSSYCNRQLSSKRSQVYRLESENERLENSEERCSSDLRDQLAGLISIEGRYNA